MKRISKDEYFMYIAWGVSRRSTCLDKQVGCVLVNKQGIILAAGYNGAPRGFEHCTTCRVKATGSKDVCPAAHAEQNALLYADPNNIYACYCTLEPCIQCTRMLMNTACERVIFGKGTNESYSGIRLWEQLHDSTTWRHGPDHRTSYR